MNIEQPAFTYVNKFASYISDLCKPLERYLGISNFGYLRIYFDYKYFYICNNPKLIKEYIHTINSTTIFFEKELRYPKASGEFKCITWPTESSSYSMDLYLKHNYWHGLTFAKTSEEYVELWWVATDPNNTNIGDFYSNYIDVLEKFIYYFQSKTKNTFSFKEKGVLAKFNEGVDFSSVKDIFNNQNSQEERVSSFLNEIKLSSIEVKSLNGQIKLSSRELECIHLLSFGKTAKEIALKLNISNRTVEYYFSRIKCKTGCGFKSDLIGLYHDQLVKYF